MRNVDSAFRLFLMGAFRLETADGVRIPVSSKRGQALIAMLGSAASGERTRSWVQSQLWGSRDEEQGRASLRRELSTLRQLLQAEGCDMLCADNSRVWIDLSKVEIDVRDGVDPAGGDFLEGLDLSGEEAFEDWLREERQRLASKPALLAEARAAITQPVFGDRPALAVLPFAASGDEEADAAAEGISEDLIDRLSRLRWIPVIARSSSFALSAEVRDARNAGAALGARYVVEGTIRPEGEGHRLSCALIDAESGQTLWSSRVGINSSAEGVALDQLLTGIAATLGLSIDQAEQQRAIRKPESDLNVSDLIWKGRWHLNRFTKADVAIARDCFDKALKQEPNSPEAIIQSAWTRLWELWLHRGSQDDIKTVRTMAQRAIIADYEDARGHMLAGVAEAWLRQPLRSEALLKRSIELNPSLVLGHAHLGCTYYLAGNPADAIRHLIFSIRLSPNDHTLFFTEGELAMAHLLSGELDQALVHADHSLTRRQGYWLAHVVKVNALARLGLAKEAVLALTELTSVKSGFKPAMVDWIPFTDRGPIDFLKEGLNLAAG